MQTNAENVKPSRIRARMGRDRHDHLDIALRGESIDAAPSPIPASQHLHLDRQSDQLAGNGVDGHYYGVYCREDITPGPPSP